MFYRKILIPGMLICMICACAATRSDIEGRYQGDTRPNTQVGKVSIAFVFNHARQMKGYDVIPKTLSNYEIIKGFDEIFKDSLNEISNVGRYATFTEAASDVKDTARRAQRDSLVSSHDYTIAMNILRETSFVKRSFGWIVSYSTLTSIPVSYTQIYRLTATVNDRDGRLIKRYARSARITNWVQTFLVVAYPFHPPERKTEEVYSAFLHDVFREIESDHILIPLPDVR